MVPDPEPDNLITVSYPKRPVGESDSRREDGSGGVDLPEPQARMGGVVIIELVGHSGPALNVLGKQIVGLPERSGGS